MKQAQESYKSLNTLKMYLGLNGEDYWHIDYPLYDFPYDGKQYYWDLSKKAELCPGPFDDNGILEFIAQDQKKYKHVISICHYAIGAYEVFIKNKDENFKVSFLKQADWLCENQQKYKGINGVWVNLYPIYMYGLTDESVSSMAQGMGISVLTRAYKLTSNKKYLEAAKAAIEIFFVDVKNGGVLREVSDGFICYEEYSTLDYPSCVLNGYITALLGLYDLILINGFERANVAYEKGLKSLINNLYKWDCKIWSLYDLYNWGTNNYASYFYHNYHVNQLLVMYRITNEKIFLTYSSKWKKSLNNPIFRLVALVKKVLFRLNGRL